MGLSLSLQKGGAGSRAQEAIAYLFTGMEALLNHNTHHVALNLDDQR